MTNKMILGLLKNRKLLCLLESGISNAELFDKWKNFVPPDRHPKWKYSNQNMPPEKWAALKGHTAVQEEKEATHKSTAGKRMIPERRFPRRAMNGIFIFSFIIVVVVVVVFPVCQNPITRVKVN